MPPPSLSTTTIVRSMPRRARAEQAVGVVQEGDVADQQRRRSGAPAPAPRRPRWTPRRRCRWPRGWRGPADAVAGRGEPLDVAHRHRRRDDQRRRRRAAAAPRSRAIAGSVGSAVTGEHRRRSPRPPRRRRAPSRPRHPSAGRVRRLRAPRQSRPGTASGGTRSPGSATTSPSRVRSGSSARRRRSTATCQASRPASHWRQHLRRRRRTEAQHHLGWRSRADRRHPQEGVEVATRRGAGTRHPLRGSASTGQPSGRPGRAPPRDRRCRRRPR